MCKEVVSTENEYHFPWPFQYKTPILFQWQISMAGFISMAGVMQSMHVHHSISQLENNCQIFWDGDTVAGLEDF